MLNNIVPEIIQFYRNKYVYELEIVYQYSMHFNKTTSCWPCRYVSLAHIKAIASTINASYSKHLQYPKVLPGNSFREVNRKKSIILMLE